MLNWITGLCDLSANRPGVMVFFFQMVSEDFVKNGNL